MGSYQIRRNRGPMTPKINTHTASYWVSGRISTRNCPALSANSAGESLMRKNKVPEVANCSSRPSPIGSG